MDSAKDGSGVDCVVEDETGSSTNGKGGLAASHAKSNLTHEDAFGRLENLSNDDRQEHYLRSSDGRLSRLRVQSFRQFSRDASTPWIRIGEPKIETPTLIRLLYWTYSSILAEGPKGGEKDDGWSLVYAKWFPSCMAMLFLLCVPRNLEGELRFNGSYDPVHYKDPAQDRIPRNLLENQHSEFVHNEPTESSMLLGQQGLAEDGIELVSTRRSSPAPEKLATYGDDLDEDFDGMPGRHFGPRYLCFLKSETEFETCLVSDWVRRNKHYGDVNYVFVSYTRKQFFVADDEEMDKWNITDAERRYNKKIAPEDRRTLQEYGMRAAREAGVRAFWLDFECLKGHNAQGDIDDVWRICDIVRAARSMVIVLGPPNDRKDERASNEARREWLRVWGTRLWTLPEILLCPTEHRVKVYTEGSSAPPEEVAKRNFPAYGAWEDAKSVRELIDHYESSVHLTPLELASIAIQCFRRRQTDQRTGGDMAYAIMGLLRRRPKVDRNDSSFEAFARLSLANDSDMLLERLVCMLPSNPDAEWSDIDDAWKAHFWNVEPHCQVAGIVDAGTVTLDGAYGATIIWDALTPPAFLKRSTTMRKVMKILLRGVPGYLFASIVLVAALTPFMATLGGVGGGYNSFFIAIFVVACITLAGAVAITLLAPVMLHRIYRGKFWSTQASFIGLEGRVDLGAVETRLFGFNYGRLKWSNNGSTVASRSLGSDADDRPDQYGRRLFTLVDTFTMTALAFRAKRPPTAVIICGREGGMQRAVLCSYDWRTRTFCRESVVRVSTLVLDRIFRIDRFRFALRRPERS